MIKINAMKNLIKLSLFVWLMVSLIDMAEARRHPVLVEEDGARRNNRPAGKLNTMSAIIQHYCILLVYYVSCN